LHETDIRPVCCAYQNRTLDGGEKLVAKVWMVWRTLFAYAIAVSNFPLTASVGGRRMAE
jgi:hypothetical protein